MKVGVGNELGASSGEQGDLDNKYPFNDSDFFRTQKDTYNKLAEIFDRLFQSIEIILKISEMLTVFL